MVKLQKMNNEEYGDFYSQIIVDYAADKVKAGTWPEKEAEVLAEESMKELLPNGKNTENHYFFTIVDCEKAVSVGYLWFMKVSETEAFIYNFLIFEEFRSMGYGTKALIALDDELKKLKLEKVSLHVFAHNEIAKSLYKKTGFLETDIQMSKHIK